MTEVAAILAAAPHVFLDFDGPVCAVFGGLINDGAAADHIRASLGADVERISFEARRSHDPFVVLRSATDLGASLAATAAASLTDIEVEAVPGAPATPGAIEAIRGLRSAGHTVTIVSNNSTAAVTAYLKLHDLTALTNGTVARTTSNVTRLKPHPHLLHVAMADRSTRPSECVLIGDSATDAHAAQAAGLPCIGYANKPGKLDVLREAGAAATVTAMHQLAPTARAISDSVDR